MVLLMTLSCTIAHYCIINVDNNSFSSSFVILIIIVIHVANFKIQCYYYL